MQKVIMQHIVIMNTGEVISVVKWELFSVPDSAECRLWIQQESNQYILLSNQLELCKTGISKRDVSIVIVLLTNIKCK